MNSFIGIILGLVGEVFIFVIIFGGLFIMYMCIVSWCIVVGVVIGVVFFVILLNLIGSDMNFMFVMFVYWYFVVGGFVFGMFFMVIDLVFVLFIN